MKPLRFLVLLPLFTGCQSVSIADQPRLSGRIFDFAATGPNSMECGLSSQLETGRAAGSNVSAGGCASCR